MRAEKRLYVVGAAVEEDEGFWDVRYYLVAAGSRTEAERMLRGEFLAGHPHDLCERGRRHVGVDKVKRGSAREFHIPRSGVVTSWDRYTEWDRRRR
jgi:hypothetical protein